MMKVFPAAGRSPRVAASELTDLACPFRSGQAVDRRGRESTILHGVFEPEAAAGVSGCGALSAS